MFQQIEEFSPWTQWYQMHTLGSQPQMFNLAELPVQYLSFGGENSTLGQQHPKLSSVVFLVILNTTMGSRCRGVAVGHWYLFSNYLHLCISNKPSSPLFDSQRHNYSTIFQQRKSKWVTQVKVFMLLPSLCTNYMSACVFFYTQIKLALFSYCIPLLPHAHFFF